MDTPERHPESEGPALAAVRAYMDAVNEGDSAAFHATLHYPHTRLAGGGIRHWEHPPAPRDIRAGLRKATPGWARTELDEARVVQSSPDKVHVAVKFTRRDAAGNALEVHRSFYVVTKIDDRWAIQLRSSFVPNRQL